MCRKLRCATGWWCQCRWFVCSLTSVANRTSASISPRVLGYGFVGGDANQWQPNLFRNTTAIYPYVGKPGWNLITAMADDAIEYMKRITAVNPAQPFFIYYVPGGVHAPHHPTPEWIKKISEMHLFDEGWNKLRDTIFANQKRLGVIPQDAKLT